MIEARTILDNGSQVNLITGRLASQLGLRAKLSSVNLSCIGANNNLKTTKKLQLEITSLHNSFRKILDFIVIPKISSYSPNESIDVLDLFKKKRIDVPLVDPHFIGARSIDIIECPSVYGNQRKFSPSTTKLCWVKIYQDYMKINFIRKYIFYGAYKRQKYLFCGISTAEYCGP